MPKLIKNVKNCIAIKGAKVHNLKNITVSIPRNKLIVITGISGSGKSSLAFDTLYAEGQRRYVESLSAYARQFLGKINKPDVDFIEGIPPAIAIEQKVNSKNPRSTVGTSTEVYDYLRLLFARIGKTFSPVSKTEVKRHDVGNVVEYIASFPEGTKMALLSPIVILPERSLNEQLELYLKQGFSRVYLNESIEQINDLSDSILPTITEGDIFLLIDRLITDNSDDSRSRYADSIETAFFEGKGECFIKVFDKKNTELKSFSNRFEADGIIFEEPTEHMFSFNNPIGACPKCEGFGQTIGIDEDLVIPNKSLSIYDEAIACWKGEKMSEWKNMLVFNASKFSFPIHKPYYQLTDSQKQLIWTGNKYFNGLNDFFSMLEGENYKIQYRVMFARYRGKTICPDCSGSRLKAGVKNVLISNKSIDELVMLSIDELLLFFKDLSLNKTDEEISRRLLKEIISRLQFLCDTGLGYLSLNRPSSTLSGGESQRINLSTSMGSSLVGSLYILDEPSIGLHSRDTHLLIKVLRNLQRIGNTVVVVEHDEEIITSADEIIDLGPFAGRLGGEVVFQGTYSDLISTEDSNGKSKSLTRQYITGDELIEIPSSRRSWNNYIEITGASENNLKNISTKIPLNIITVITGVSGSGKSSLIKNIFYPAVNKRFGGYGEKTGSVAKVDGDIHLITSIEYVDQNPIGKSSRSNPVTYLKAYDEIRKLYADLEASKYNGFRASHFSFNIDGGRCDECQGEGVINVEMQFMADVRLICESCHGKRFKQDILDIEYRGKNIYNILEMTIDESIAFFSQNLNRTEKRIINRLMPLADVGLGYVKLGQSSNTLSGGESQRIKLASILSKEKTLPGIFVFDEPTTGLHFHDIRKLITAFNALIKRGHTLVIIEHNPEIIKIADWLIDLGPEGGDKGGFIVFEGTPEDIVNCNESYTGKFLSKKINS